MVTQEQIEKEHDAVCQMIADMGYDLNEILLFDNPYSYDTAFIGISNDDRAVYDHDKMVEYVMKVSDVDEETAADEVSYNALRGLTYTSDPRKPIVVFNTTDQLEFYLQ